MNRELDFRFSTHLKRERTIPTIDGSCWDHFWVIAESPADAIKEEQSCPIFDMCTEKLSYAFVISKLHKSL